MLPLSPGLHLLHKPAGPTSFSLVQEAIDAARAARPDKRARVCHAGVLDPFARGLLVLLSGSATRLFDHLHAIPKMYEGTIAWGVETDNGDPLGKPVEPPAGTARRDPSTLTVDELDAALASLIGWHDQTPPATSNKRIDGERAYLKAHRGEAVELPPSRVYLHAAQFLHHTLPRSSRIRIVARGGYYVRALARDVGRILGCGAHLLELHRSAIGPYVDPGPGQTLQVASAEIMPWAHSRKLTDQDLGDLRAGESIIPKILDAPTWPVPEGFPDPEAPIRGFHRDRLAFLMIRKESRLHPIAEFPGGL